MTPTTITLKCFDLATWKAQNPHYSACFTPVPSFKSRPLLDLSATFIPDKKLCLTLIIYDTEVWTIICSFITNHPTRTNHHEFKINFSKNPPWSIEGLRSQRNMIAAIRELRFSRAHQAFLFIRSWCWRSLPLVTRPVDGVRAELLPLPRSAGIRSLQDRSKTVNTTNNSRLF